MALERQTLALALTAAHFIAVPVVGGYARLAAPPGQSAHLVAELSPVLLLFCAASLAGVVLFAVTVREEEGRWWAAIPLAGLLLSLAVFGPSPWSSGLSLLATVLLAPAVFVLLLGALPLERGSTAWFAAIEAAFISIPGLLWAYGLFLAPPLPANIRVDSPSLYEFAGAAYIHAGLLCLGILLLVLAWRQTTAHRP
ncbi:hypothetical protein F8E02_03075 [Methanoculleus sp. Wushi-C6]|uniref:Uncharacterized protein n=1 Tax=Methanoculleus caldifontis TaxID=2651577 RepID=A0ABU3WZ65_9EURY|nr:hypothetical protein [Methanoculleus sp. Wushi-C6]MDV2481006.1 hypothetical protein [Methanoculleus sp. Wushi-C6]